MKYFLLALSLICFQANADTQKRFRVVTWNLEHLMSENQFNQRKAFCEQHNWEDPLEEVVGEDGLRPENMNYCNALSGLDFFTKKRKSLPLQDLNAYKLKVSSLIKMEEEVSADIYALQEVRDSNAVELVFPKNKFLIISTESNISQNISFAIRKSLLKNDNISMVKSDEITALSVKDDNGHITRPGLVVTLSINGNTISFLNVHMKSGCRNDQIDNPIIKEEWTESRKEHKRKSCSMYRKQVPILENWIDENSEENYIVLGDFNRNFFKDRRIKPARLDGTNVSEPIKPFTKIGSLFWELSDENPKGSILQNLNSFAVFKSPKCHFGIDHFLLGDKLSKLSNITYSNSKAIIIDYPNDSYGVDKALPSDHCPLLMELFVPLNPSVEISILKQQSDNGSAPASLELGLILANGILVDKNHDLANSYIKRASDTWQIKLKEGLTLPSNIPDWALFLNENPKLIEGYQSQPQVSQKILEKLKSQEESKSNNTLSCPWYCPSCNSGGCKDIK